ncbi:MAG: glycosyl transferase family 2 [Cyanobacteria bacterium RYN_339]|nr:glycosyl transferase family 2 [Cyanobacteria bacterium RYN_339]
MGLRRFSLAVVAACLVMPVLPALAAAEAVPALDADALVAAGHDAVERGSIEQGVAFFKQSLAITPSRAVLVDLGCALADLEKWDDAKKAFQGALDTKADDAAALNGLGYVFYRQAKMAEAIGCYRQALAGRDDPQYRLNLGLAYLSQERWGQAADEFAATVAAQPQDFWGHNDLGYALQKSGKLESAARQYSQAIALGRDDVTAHLNLGGLLLEARAWDGAVRVYADALRKQDKSPEAHLGLAIAYSHLNRLPEAQREARLSERLAPERAQGHHMLAEIYRKRKRWAESIAEARKATALAPLNATYQLVLGAALEGAGRNADAAAAYDRFLLLEPEGAQARDVKMRARLLR